MDNQRPPAEVEIDTSSLTNQLVNVSSVSLNVSQNVIITTEDKVRLCLSECRGGQVLKCNIYSCSNSFFTRGIRPLSSKMARTSLAVTSRN
jgi:hypothetical protein